MQIRIHTFLFLFFIGSLSLSAQDSRDFARVDSLMNIFQYEQALNLLENEDSLSTEGLLRQGQCYYRLGASGQAIRPFETILEHDSLNTLALIHLGQLYARNQSYEKAMKMFEKLTSLDTTNSYYFKQAGTMARLSGKDFRAVDWYYTAMTLNPSDVESALHLGALLVEYENYGSADSVITRGLQSDPEFLPLNILQAKSTFEQKKYPETIQLSNQLLSRTDTTVSIARMLGVSYYHLERYEEVIKSMQFLLANRQDHEWIYYYLGVATRELGQLEASVAWFRTAAAKAVSENARVYYAHLGQSYEAMGDHANAIRAYRTALDFSDNGIYLYHLARNYDMY